MVPCTAVLTLLLSVVPSVMSPMVLLPMMRGPVVPARPVMAPMVVPVVMAVAMVRTTLLAR